MKEFTNFLNGKLYNNSLPIILIIAGFDGSDKTSSYFLSTLISNISQNYLKNPDIFYLLNNYKLLIVPSLNVEAIYNNRSKEKTENGDMVSVENDFNFGVTTKGKSCFKSSSARLLAHLFQVK